MRKTQVHQRKNQRRCPDGHQKSHQEFADVLHSGQVIQVGVMQADLTHGNDEKHAQDAAGVEQGGERRRAKAHQCARDHRRQQQAGLACEKHDRAWGGDEHVAISVGAMATRRTGYGPLRSLRIRNGCSRNLQQCPWGRRG